MESKQGFKPSFWGPHAWVFLHTVSLNYNPKHKAKYRSFFTKLGNVLPCKKCRENYKMHLKKYPMNEKVMKTRRSFAKWLFEIHNQTSKLLKKSYTKTFTQTMKKYEKHRSKPKNNK